MSSKFNIPTAIVVFGATGDLAKKKIFPALFNLYQNGLLPEKFSIIGSSRSAHSNEKFREYLTKVIHDFEDCDVDNKKLAPFLELCTYEQAQFDSITDYKRIAGVLGRNDDYWRICSNKLYYLAVPPIMYKGMLMNLHNSGLTEPCSPEEGWTRVLIEKPFGSDSQTAEEIDKLLGKLFKEEQVYRIDHYLAKEMVQNILTFRFANNLLEQSWNSRFIEKIEFRMLENFNVDTRGSFYDPLGALRDVGQNHILQMVALTLMDCPRSFSQEEIRLRRSEVLSQLHVLSGAAIKENTVRAQYEGYRKTNGVDPESTRETYFRVRTYINSPRWRGMPIYLESGKALHENRSEVIVTFRQNMTQMPGFDSEKFRNMVRFSIDPDEQINISFISKKPGLKFDLHENTFKFILRDRRPKNRKAEEYERVLLDCIRGDQMLFVTTSEVKSMWKFIDPIVDAWEENKTELYSYPQGSDEIIKKAAEDLETPADTISVPKRIGMIGLGKMGGAAALNLKEHGWDVHAYNRSYEVTEQYAQKGIHPAKTIKDLVDALPSPRVFWIMVPAGKPVEEMIFGPQGNDGLLSYLEKGDIIIDAGNSNYKDTQRIAKEVIKTGVQFMDVGTSGGPGGARTGACLMIGGEEKTYKYLMPLFTDLALPDGFRFFPGYGAGHFTKMVHNGIEYGMMQALAEGFEVLKKSDYKLDLERVAEIYNTGSVIESRLTNWLLDGLRLYGTELKELSTTVHHSGEGQWTIEAANQMNVPVPIIEGSLQYRIDSPKHKSYTGRVLNLLRRMFGGHQNT